MKTKFRIYSLALALSFLMTLFVSSSVLPATASNKLTIINATSDCEPAAPRAAATAAVENLRAPDGLWFMAQTNKAGSHADSVPGECFLELTLEKVSKVDELKVQWYQGDKGAPDYAVVDPADSRMRRYDFYITVSSDGVEWEQAWPKSGVITKTSTGVDFETYPINMGNVLYIRIHSTGSIGDIKGEGNNMYVCIRNVEAYGISSGVQEDVEPDLDKEILVGDCDGDGRISANDIARLAQYVAGWDVTLGSPKPSTDSDEVEKDEIEKGENDLNASLKIEFNDASASPLSSLTYTQDVPSSAQTVADPINPKLSDQFSGGALRLSASGKIEADSGFIRNTLSAGTPDPQSHNFVGDTGSTLDFAVRFNELPEATDSIIKVDANGDFSTSGISSSARGQLGRQLGFVVNVHSVKDFLNPDGTVKIHTSGTNKDQPYSTEYYLSFVAYDNEVLGTNAAIIFITGSASGWTSWTTSKREVFFCNLDFGADAEYHRYTLTTDYAKGLEGKDMVTLYIDGEAVKTFSAPAYRNYNATLGDYVNLSLNLNGYCETDESYNLSMAVTMDELNIYGEALIPADYRLSSFSK